MTKTLHLHNFPAAYHFLPLNPSGLHKLLWWSCLPSHSPTGKWAARLPATTEPLPSSHLPQDLEIPLVFKTQPYNLYLWGNNISKTPSTLCNVTHQMLLRCILCTEALPCTASRENGTVNTSTRMGCTCFITGQAQDKCSRYLGPVSSLLYSTEKEVSLQHHPLQQFWKKQVHLTGN